MYSINAETLKIAFKKLKTHYYYSASSLYLKKKIVEFENQIHNKSNSFESIANKLNNMVYGHMSLLKSSDVDYVVYPKKNTFKKEYDSIKTDCDCLNCFIDMDIEFFLVDVIFTLNLLETTEHFVNREVSYSGRVDECIKTGKVNNSYLFSNYFAGYQKWKSIPKTILKDNPNKDLTLIRLDLKKCYYSCFFDFNKITKYLFGNNDCVSLIMKSVYNLYTQKVQSATKSQFVKEKNICVLPVGLFSSSILLNFLFSEFDNFVSSKSNVMGYGRYVDDMIFVIKGKKDEKLEKLLPSLFPKYFTIANNEIILQPSSILEKGVSLNKEKSYARHIKRDENELNDEEELIDNPSFIDFNDDEKFLNTAIEETKDLEEFREHLHFISTTNGNREYKLFKALSKMDNAEVLNSFPVWFNTLSILKNSNYCNQAIEIIRKSINSLRIHCSLNERLLKTLNDELEFSIFLSNHSAGECCYIANINQTDINIYLESIRKNDRVYEFFPKIITSIDASYYFQSQLIGGIGYSIFDLVSELLARANGVVNQCDCFDERYSYDSRDVMDTRRICIDIKADKVEKTRIALAALNMHKLEDSKSIDDEVPQNYSLFDLELLIIEARKHGAKYIVFPEFSIDYSWIVPLALVAKKNNITLIGGITHQLMQLNNEVINLTMLFDRHSKTIILKPKNYMPPEEQEIIINRYGKKCFTPKTPYYYVVNDGTLKYSFMTCYEITNITDRERLADRINTLFLPVYNKDTSYFSSIICSYSRDVSCFIAQANSNVMGDTCIRQPTKHLDADVVKIRGGINNYLVVGEIDVDKLKSDNKSYLSNKIDYCSKDKKDTDYKPYFKPLSAGDHHCSDDTEDDYSDYLYNF